MTNFEYWCACILNLFCYSDNYFVVCFCRWTDHLLLPEATWRTAHDFLQWMWAVAALFLCKNSERSKSGWKLHLPWLCRKQANNAQICTAAGCEKGFWPLTVHSRFEETCNLPDCWQLIINTSHHDSVSMFWSMPSNVHVRSIVA